jgi:hypothetical protein
VTVPNNQEALNHVLVRFQLGTPWAYETFPNPNQPVGTCSASAGCVIGSVFSVSTPELTSPSAAWPLYTVYDDYSVVVGVDRSGNGQASGTLSPNDSSLRTFANNCIVNGQLVDQFVDVKDSKTLPPCSGGAVRIVPFGASQNLKNGVTGGAALVWAVGDSPVPLINWPTAAMFLAAFALSGSPGAAALGTPQPTPAAMGPNQLYTNTGALFDSPTDAPVTLYTFPAGSILSRNILNDPDFQTLLTDTLTYHNSDVVNAFKGQPGGTVMTLPVWDVLGACSNPNANPANCTTSSPSFFSTDADAQGDQPPLFPCQMMYGTPSTPECDLTFSTSGDLHNAFGRVGYSLSLQATVKSSGGQLVLTSLAITGYIYDYYQWDPQVNDYIAAIQAGYMGPGYGGLIYKDQVVVTTAPGAPFTGVTFVFQ